MDTVTRVDQLKIELNCGSVWHRWDPHVHAPGTLLNNQFTGEDPWGGYFDALEASDPPIRAVGVTVYYLTAHTSTFGERRRTADFPILASSSPTSSCASMSGR